MIISQKLQYNAPNYPPQLYICFGTCPSGTMQTTVGKTSGYIDVEYVIPAAQQRYDAAKMEVMVVVGLPRKGQCFGCAKNTFNSNFNNNHLYVSFLFQLFVQH